MVLNMGAADNFWTVAELRMYGGGRELPRSPEWRLSARPNGWEVQLAFDNSYATRWSTWQGIAPHARLQVDFPAARRVDQVLLVAHDAEVGQRGIRRTVVVRPLCQREIAAPDARSRERVAEAGGGEVRVVDLALLGRGA